MLDFFKKKNLFLSEGLIGVDFSNSVVKLAQVSRGRGRDKVAGYAKKRMPKGLIKDYLISDEEAFKNFFKEIIESVEGSLQGRKLAVGVPEAKVFTRVLEIPLMSKSEAGETVKWETESNIPISIKDVYYDWQILEKNKKTMRVLVMAAPVKIIDNYLSAFNRAGYKVAYFEPQSVANGRSVLKFDQKGFSLLVDIGLEYSNFAVYEDGAPIFVTNSSVCGKVFTDAVVKHLGTSFAKAESYKIKTGLGRNKKEKEESAKIFASVLANLTQDIEKTINFFRENIQEESRKEQIDKIILAGGGSNLKGLKAYLSHELNMEVRRSNSWTNFNLKGNIPLIPKDEAQSFTTVIGLSLRNFI
ncbi:MAG: type IV pilus assembly protein PilM [Patescibacteria group bacterium]